MALADFQPAMKAAGGAGARVLCSDGLPIEALDRRPSPPLRARGLIASA